MWGLHHNLVDALAVRDRRLHVWHTVISATGCCAQMRGSSAICGCSLDGCLGFEETQHRMGQILVHTSWQNVKQLCSLKLAEPSWQQTRHDAMRHLFFQTQKCCD
jgi:hypothetical protein